MSGFLLAICVLLFVVVYLAAMSVRASSRTVSGGGKKRDSPHVAVDTLNLAHWLDDTPLTFTGIIGAIDATAPALKKKFPGRVMYILKDRNTTFNDDDARRAYQACAERNKIYLVVAEKYEDPPRGNARSRSHSAEGRDDFLMAVLANRWQCLALTEDRLRDFQEFRKTLQPFYAYEFAFWRSRPEREAFRPESTAYAKLRKPRVASFSEFF